MHWPLASIALGFTAGALLLASAARYDGDLNGAVLRMIAGLACCGLGIVVALACEFLTWR